MKESGTFVQPSAGVIQCPQADIDGAGSGVRSASALKMGRVSLTPSHERIALIRRTQNLITLVMIEKFMPSLQSEGIFEQELIDLKTILSNENVENMTRPAGHMMTKRRQWDAISTWLKTRSKRKYGLV